jgi:hypothetical protein
MSQSAAKGSPVLDRRIAQKAGGIAEDAAVLLDKLVVMDIAVSGEGADRQLVAILPNIAQVVQAVQVDKDSRSCEPEPHEWYQGVPSGYELGVLSVLAQELYGVVYRLGDLVVESYGNH